jgi:hypothetical protein
MVLEFELRAMHLIIAVPLEPTPKPFFAFTYFSGRVLRFCPGPASNHNPPIYIASGMAGITAMSHPAVLSCLDRALIPIYVLR